MTYQAPVAEMMQALETAGLSDLAARGVLSGVDAELVASLLTEAGRFATDELAPLNEIGDRAGPTLSAGVVTLVPGWAEAYRRWAEAGWNALPGPVEHGGQGLPHLVSMAACEIWNAANLSFGLAPLLTQGATDAIHIAASAELKARYLPKMVAGTWTGTMNLTEPHAGTDLGALRTRAVPAADGSYRLFGTKIYITYGEHEMTENIIHLVLARLPDAPTGTKGISLFLVPKYLVGDDGTPGSRNDLECTGLEKKLGIHGSPTCVMTYGAKDGAVGYLVGEANRGLNAMFIMMNRARLAVGVQGVAVAERATQRALHYANQRRQGRTETTPASEMAPIVEHPDVRRMLLTMRASTAAARAICYATAAALDISERASDSGERARAAARVALLTPVAKSFATDTAVEVASLGVQVHGGSGFIEQTGAAQHYRDARILPIYEGTNGVQAIDLVTRKLPLEGGAVVEALLRELAAVVDAVKASNRPSFGRMGEALGEATTALGEVTAFMGRELAGVGRDRALAGATPYQRLFGLAVGGALLAQGALAADRRGDGAAEVTIARFFAENIATASSGLARTVVEGGDGLLAADAALFRA